MARKAPVVVSMQVVRNHVVCKKCNVTLCEKNEMLYKRSYKGVQYFLNMGVCGSCHGRPSNFCRYKYADPILDECSILQQKRIDKKMHRLRHLEKFRARQREFQKNTRVNISNDYSIICLLSSTNLNLTKSDITPEMIEIHKKQLIIKRELKNQGIWVR